MQCFGVMFDFYNNEYLNNNKAILICVKIVTWRRYRNTYKNYVLKFPAKPYMSILHMLTINFFSLICILVRAKTLKADVSVYIRNEICTVIITLIVKIK